MSDFKLGIFGTAVVAYTFYKIGRLSMKIEICNAYIKKNTEGDNGNTREGNVSTE